MGVGSSQVAIYKTPSKDFTVLVQFDRFTHMTSAFKYFI